MTCQARRLWTDSASSLPRGNGSMIQTGPICIGYGRRFYGRYIKRVVIRFSNEIRTSMCGHRSPWYRYVIIIMIVNRLVYFSI